MAHEIGQEIKDSEVYPNQHEPWQPNHVVFDESGIISADEVFYVTEKLFEYECTDKAQDFKSFLHAGLIVNGTILSIIDGLREEEQKGDNDADSD